MPRLQRIHVPGGLYYVRHRSSTERAIFKDNDDYAQFEAILAHALEQFEIRAHAFCWQPGSIHLAVEIGTIQLSRFIQAVASRYVSVAKLRKEYSTQLFPRRHEALLIDKKYLPQLVRYVHQIPFLDRHTALPADFQWSSHRAYLQRTQYPWVTTQPTLQTFSHSAEEAVVRYDAFMQEEGVSSPRLFAKRPCRDPRIVGDAPFVVTLPRNLAIRRTSQTLEGIIDSVLLQQGVTREELTAPRDKKRTAVLARALITYHSVEREIATYTAVGRAVNRSVPSLKAAVDRYKRSERHGHLFRAGTLQSAWPIVTPMLDRK